MRTFKLAAALLGASAIVPAAAQTSGTVPDVVVSSSLVPVDSRNVGASVTVITAQDLQRRGVATVADALRTVPGVSIGVSGGRGNLTQVRMRGTDANHTRVVIDGVTVNGVIDGDFNYADFPVDDIERIEVVRGPQSGIWGANAQGGVISIIKRGGRGLARPEARARVEVGNRNSHLGSLTARGAAGPAYGSFSLQHLETNGFNIARVGPENDGSRAFVATAKGGIDLNEHVNIETNARYTDRTSSSDPTRSGVVVDGPDKSFYEAFSGRVAGTVTLLDGRWVQRFTGTRFDEASTFNNFSSLPYRYFGVRDTIEYRSALRFDSPFLADARHTAVVGLDHETEKFQQFSAFFGAVDAERWRVGIDRERRGLFGEILTDLPWGLSLTGALRQDDFNAFQDATTWRVTANQVIPATGTRLRANVGTGYTVPTFIELFGFFPSGFRGNPNLRPESSIGWDIGIEQAIIPGRLTVDVTRFDIRMKDRISSAFIAGASTVINAPGISPRSGVEVGATFVPLDWLSFRGTYTFTESAVGGERVAGNLSVGYPSIRVPKHAASLDTTATFAEGRGRLNVGVVYNGRRPDLVFTTPQSRTFLSPYTLVSAQLSWDVTPAHTVYVRAENILDRRFEEPFSYRAPGFMAFAGLRVRLGGDQPAVVASSQAR